MAQIYQRVFTYTGQSAFTITAPRKVPFSSFVVSGDTDRTIRQIVSIQYVHTHSNNSSSVTNWTLTGRLVTGSKNIDSAPLTQIIGKEEVKTFVNNFTTLPTPEEFASITEVQTLDTDGSAEYNGRLTWKASAEHPIKIIVEFYDQPPVQWAPTIDSFAVARANSNGSFTDEGTYILTTLKLSFASGAPTSTATVKLYTSTDPDKLGTESNLLANTNINSLISGITSRAGIITGGSHDIGFTYYFTVVVTIGEETATARAQAYRAKAPIHITNNGVSFGNFSSATESDPKEEFHNPVVFYKGFSMGGGNDVLSSIGVKAGTTDAYTITKNTYTEIQASFGMEFENNPVVVVGLYSGEGLTDADFGGVSCTISAVSTTGFKARVYNSVYKEYMLVISWIAVGTPK